MDYLGKLCSNFINCDFVQGRDNSSNALLWQQSVRCGYKVVLVPSDKFKNTAYVLIITRTKTA